MMWASLFTSLASLVPALVKIWGPPSDEDLAKLAAAIKLLPIPGPAEAALEYIRAKAPQA